MLSDRATSALNRGTTCGVVGLALAGFAMSYDALHALAAQQGVPAPLAWLWPLVVDGFIVVASLSVVRAVAEERRAFYPWALVLAFSAVSVAFNVVHATPTLVARLVSAIPPAALVLSFELLMRQLRAALRMTTEPLATTGPHHASDSSPAASEPTNGIASPASTTPLLEQARHIYATHQHARERVTGVVLARELGISDGYARRLLRRLTTDSGGTAC